MLYVIHRYLQATAKPHIRIRETVSFGTFLDGQQFLRSGVRHTSDLCGPIFLQ
jgi:hypothetical protein